MKRRINRIAVLTRDCSGVNAALRAVVRTADSLGIEVWGVIRHYEGLIKGDFRPLSRIDVSGILNNGGTILKTSRCRDFMTPSGQKKAVDQVKRHEIDALIVIGGNGSLAGAHVLASEYDLKVVGVPTTIDNDINGVEMSIGADTAVNVAMEAIDKIRDTAFSLERIFVVEVMGRKSGFIASQVALAGGCEELLIPEVKDDFSNLLAHIKEGNKRGKVSWIIVVAEGRAKAHEIAEKISVATGLETRVAVLGHIQRGGRPTAFDRILAARLGNYAVRVLVEGGTDVCVRMECGQLSILPLEEAIQPKRFDFETEAALIKILT